MQLSGKAVKLLNKVHCPDLEEVIRGIEDRNGRTDSRILEDAVEYQLLLYTIRSTETSKEYRKAIRELASYRAGKIILAENEVQKDRAAVNQYRRLKSLEQKLRKTPS